MNPYRGCGLLPWLLMALSLLFARPTRIFADVGAQHQESMTLNAGDVPGN